MCVLRYILSPCVCWYHLIVPPNSTSGSSSNVTHGLTTYIMSTLIKSIQWSNIVNLFWTPSYKLLLPPGPLTHAACFIILSTKTSVPWNSSELPHRLYSFWLPCFFLYYYSPFLGYPFSFSTTRSCTPDTPNKILSSIKTQHQNYLTWVSFAITPKLSRVSHFLF